MNMMEPLVVIKTNNPWEVGSLEEFLFYNCPECPDKSSSRETFIHHALFSHPDSRNAILSIKEFTEVKHPIKEEAFDDDSVEDYYYGNEDDVIKENDENEPKPPKAKKAKRSRISIEVKLKDSTTEVQCYYCSELMEGKGIVKHIKEVHQKLTVENKMFGDKRPYKCEKCNGSLKEEAENSPNHKCQTVDLKKSRISIQAKLLDSSKEVQCYYCSQLMEEKEIGIEP
jgi:uncharacterized Zn-finger protein